jgi:hypothetical protein
MQPGAGGAIGKSRSKASQIVFSPAVLAKNNSDITVSATVDVPNDYAQTRFAVLLEPNQEIRGLKADAVDSGKPLALSTENGGRGIWYWYWADLTPGKHSVELTIHSAAAAHVSAWLLTHRESEVSSQPGELPQSSTLRGTHLLLEETIR